MHISEHQMDNSGTKYKVHITLKVPGYITYIGTYVCMCACAYSSTQHMFTSTYKGCRKPSVGSTMMNSDYADEAYSHTYMHTCVHTVHTLYNNICIM